MYKLSLHCTDTKTEQIKKPLKSQILLDLKFRCITVKSQWVKDLLKHFYDNLDSIYKHSIY